jgi:hypothetical protein
MISGLIYVMMFNFENDVLILAMMSSNVQIVAANPVQHYITMSGWWQ